MQAGFFARFVGTVRHGLAGFVRFGVPGPGWLEDDHGGADEPSLIGEAGGENLADFCAGGGFGVGFGQVMALGVENFVDGGHERDEAHAAGDVAAGILKEGQLLDQRALGGLLGGAIQGVGMVKKADDDLNPLGFRAAQFFDFEAKVGLFAVVGVLEEFAEGGGLGGNFGGDVPGGGDGVGGVFLNDLPAGGGGVDLRGDHFEVLNFRDGGNEAAALDHSDGGAVFEHERKNGQRRAGGGGRHEHECLPAAQRRTAVQHKDKARQGQEDGIAQEERPFWQLEFGCIAHKSTQHSQKAPGSSSLCEDFTEGERRRPMAGRVSLRSTRAAGLTNTAGVRICVIFNPTAKGEKAKRFRRHLDLIAAECALKQTVAAGGARSLATQAVREGFDTVVAAGGDGTLNEVLNGIGDLPDGFERARLAVLPLGTVNVFARELGLPMNLKRDWEIIRAGKEAKIDLPCVECAINGGVQRRYFAQLAGAGLDARAVDLVDWQLKKKIGPLAYIWAGILALRQPASVITFTSRADTALGEMVLVGNGRFYGGPYRFFPRSDLRNGRLEICVIPKSNWQMLVWCGASLLTRGELPGGAARSFHGETFTLTSPMSTPLELDGESVGHLPATFSIQPQKLRVIVP